MKIAHVKEAQSNVWYTWYNTCLLLSDHIADNMLVPPPYLPAFPFYLSNAR